MSTAPDEVRPRKHFTPAEIEAALAAAPHLTTPLTCQEMCDEIQNDMDTLENLWEIPVKLRAHARVAFTRAIAALNHQMKQQHCPACED